MSRFFSSRFASLEAYTPGEQPQDQSYTKLNTNESPYPPSPATVAAVTETELNKLNLYSDPTGRRLREALAELYGLQRENVILANGSDEILSFAFMAFADKETPVAFPAISYGFYPVYADLYGLEATKVPLLPDFSVDVEALAAAKGMIVIANPNAPTGIALSLDKIEYLLKSDRDRIVLVDEAYVDFGAESALPLLQKYDNLLIIRTYSKSRSMAGARLGFAFGSPEIIADLETIRYSTNPYNLDRLALLLGEAAVKDDGYYKRNCEKIAATRAAAEKRLKEMGFTMTPSTTNFLFVKHPAVSGETLYLGLKERGVLVRHFNKPLIQDYLRITVGTPEQMETLFAAIADMLSKTAPKGV
ncbi:MAG: histidinol-phosphate transaminase [Clostridiales bacterium]|nr:histidinol-phosphate transaminase [Clostridiales bacterium]